VPGSLSLFLPAHILLLSVCPHQLSAKNQRNQNGNVLFDVKPSDVAAILRAAVIVKAGANNTPMLAGFLDPFYLQSVARKSAIKTLQPVPITGVPEEQILICRGGIAPQCSMPRRSPNLLDSVGTESAKYAVSRCTQHLNTTS
jgi:hypothetical protein